ncbi:MAG: hypothetical protein ACIWVG_16090 [Gloeotrichia echinulata HAB0833]
MSAIAEATEIEMPERVEAAELRRKADLFLVSGVDELELRRRAEDTCAGYRRIVDKTRNSSREIASNWVRKYDVFGVAPTEKDLRNVAEAIDNLKAERDTVIQIYRTSAIKLWGESPNLLKVAKEFRAEVQQFYNQMIESRKELKRDLLEIIKLPNKSGKSYVAATAYFLAYQQIDARIALSKMQVEQDDDEFYVALELFIPIEIYQDTSKLIDFEILVGAPVAEQEPALLGLCAVRYLPQTSVVSDDSK